MRIYKNTIEHCGWEDDINELAIYATWPMTKHEFVQYYNGNIADMNTHGCEDYGVVHNIYRFNDRVDKFPWLEYILGKDDDGYDLKFSDDTDDYKFVRYSFDVVGLDTDEEIYNKVMKSIRRGGERSRD